MRFPCTFAELCDLLLALGLIALFLLLTACGGTNGGATPPADEPAAAAPAGGQAPALPRFSRAPAGGSGQPAGPRVLVLYDPGDGGDPRGREHALLLANLLGHFNARSRLAPVSAYRAGQLNEHDALFYLGSVYDQPARFAPDSAAAAAWQALLADVAAGTRPVVWINYNLWHLDAWLRAHGQDGGLAARWGFAWQGIFDAGYNRVRYRGAVLYKGVSGTPGAGACATDPDGTHYDCSTTLNTVTVTDPARVMVHGTALRAGGDAEAPWALQSGRFWFVADMPFAYASEADRYLAFADLLHEMLGIAHERVPRRALLRLEDVSPATDPAALQAVVEWLLGHRIPFSVATIPVYADPAGVHGDADPAPPVILRDSAVGDILRRAAAGGLAAIVQHGTTHQWDGGPNPFDQVTGSDFEFFRVLPDGHGGQQAIGPLPEDSPEWARRRIRLGLEVLLADGLVPFAWEPPHYLASETDHEAIRASFYPVIYGRVNYAAEADRPARFVTQFFPYVIERDRHGYRVIPEDLGYVPAGSSAATDGVDRLLQNARHLLVVRDGVASAFFHPRMGVAALERLVTGLQAQGYEFIAACGLALHCPVSGGGP